MPQEGADYYKEWTFLYAMRELDYMYVFQCFAAVRCTMHFSRHIISFRLGICHKHQLVRKRPPIKNNIPAHYCSECVTVQFESMPWIDEIFPLIPESNDERICMCCGIAVQLRCVACDEMWLAKCRPQYLKHIANCKHDKLAGITEVDTYRAAVSSAIAYHSSRSGSSSLLKSSVNSLSLQAPSSPPSSPPAPLSSPSSAPAPSNTVLSEPE